MDSRTIFASAKTNLRKIEWEKTGESQWKHLDFGPDKKNIREILSYLSDSRVYLDCNPDESREVEKADLLNLIRNLHGKEDFRIWTRSFRYVVEMTKSGVYRKGERRPDRVEHFLVGLFRFFFEVGRRS